MKKKVLFIIQIDRFSINENLNERKRLNNTERVRVKNYNG